MAEEAVPQPQEAPVADPVVADEPLQQQEEQQQQQQEQQQQEQQPISTPVSTPSAASGAGVHQLQLYLQLVVQQHGIQPGICKRGERPPAVTGKVSDWSSVKKSKTTVTSTKKEGGAQQRERENPRSRWAQQRAGVHKIAGTAGRTFTSRFRGVHQTFPTKRWEAQFRRNGKPTSLGCFDQEDEAARAYDRMMLWCEIHGAAGSMKGSVTNFDLGEYEKDIAWLTSITQDDLIEALRSEGRKQAMNRQSGAVRRSHDTRGARSGGASDGDAGGDATAEGADTTAGHNDDSMDVAGDAGAGGAAGAADGAAAAAAAAAEVEAAMAYAQADAAAAAAAAAAAGAMYDASAAGHLLQDAAAAAAAAAAAGRELMQDQVMQDADLAHHLAQQAHAGVGPLSVVLPGSAAAGAGAGAGANPLASPEAAAAAAAAAFLSPGALTSASPEALNLLFGSIGQDALAAVQQLQQQLDQAAASGAQPDADAAAAAAFQIGQIAGTNLLAALSANPSPAAGAAAAAAAGAGVPLPFGAAGGGDALAAYGLDDAAAAALAAVGGEDMTVGLQGGTGQQLQ